MRFSIIKLVFSVQVVSGQVVVVMQCLEGGRDSQFWIHPALLLMKAWSVSKE